MQWVRLGTVVNVRTLSECARIRRSPTLAVHGSLSQNELHRTQPLKVTITPLELASGSHRSSSSSRMTRCSPYIALNTRSIRSQATKSPHSESVQRPDRWLRSARPIIALFPSPVLINVGGSVTSFGHFRLNKAVLQVISTFLYFAELHMSMQLSARVSFHTVTTIVISFTSPLTQNTSTFPIM